MSQENKILNTVEDLKNGGEVEGPGFTVREGDSNSRTLGPKVQFRTGETSDTVIAREQKRSQKEAAEEFSIPVAVENIILKPDLSSESKTTEIKINEVEQLKKDKADLQKVREKLGLHIVEEESAVGDQIIKEKIKIEFIKDIGKSLVRLSSALQDFEGSMVRNHFDRISFNFEELNVIAARENINFKEVNDFLDTFQANLRKSFTTKNEANKVVSDPHYYSMALDSLDTVKANFINLRSLINRNPESKSLPDLSNLAFNLTKTISTIARKADELDELRITLLKYKNR